MTDKEKLHQILSLLWKNDDNVGKTYYNQALQDVQTAIDLQEKPVSEDLEEASREWLIPQLDKSYANYGEVKMMELTHFDGYAMLDAIEFGAKWQKEQQFEKNRLAACDKQTEEEAEIERDFVMSIIEKEHRQPTFDDAIKYGMNLQKQELTKDAVETYVDFSMAYKLNIKEGQKVKLIIIKED